jgi:hypothetical protein
MPLKNRQRKMIVRSLLISLTIALLSGCASGPESVTTEHKGKVTIVHHRRRSSSGLVDRIEAISAKGVVTQAEIHVYDIGRLPHGDNGVDEAHRYYRIEQSQRPNLMLPKGISSGHRTVYTPPNYVPPPKDQRINDAVAEANAAREKLEAAAKQVQDRLAEDYNLRGELQAQIEENQRLRDQINAGMSSSAHPTNTPAQTEAQKAAQDAVSSLMEWGQQANQ